MPIEPLEDRRQRLAPPGCSNAEWPPVRERGHGGRASVQGDGEPMAASIRLNRLGAIANATMQAIGMAEAFNETLPLVGQALEVFENRHRSDPSGPVRVPIDLVSLSEFVLTGLCAKWVGLPDGKHLVAGGRVDGPNAPPRGCDFTTTPRLDALEDDASQGRAALKAVEGLLESGGDLGTLGAEIRARLAIGEEESVIARSIGRVLLGFPPTVHCNFLRTMETWIDDKVLWACQQALVDVPFSVTEPFDRARQALLRPLLATMREPPRPEVPWRSSEVGNEGVHDDSPHVTRQGPEALKTLPARPGCDTRTGVLLGLIAGLLDAGTLRPSGSPVLLMLTRNPAPS